MVIAQPIDINAIGKGVGRDLEEDGLTGVHTDVCGEPPNIGRACIFEIPNTSGSAGQAVLCLDGVLRRCAIGKKPKQLSLRVECEEQDPLEQKRGQANPCGTTTSCIFQSSPLQRTVPGAGHDASLLPIELSVVELSCGLLRMRTSIG